MAMSAFHSVRAIPIIDQGGLEKERANLFGVALWMDAHLSVLNLVIVKKEEKDIPSLPDSIVSQAPY